MLKLKSPIVKLYGLREDERKKKYLPYKFNKAAYKPDLFEKCLTFIKAAGPKAIFYQDRERPERKAGVLRSGNLEALIMPVIFYD